MENFRCQSHPDYLMKWSEINRGNSMKKEVEQFGQKKKRQKHSMAYNQVDNRIPNRSNPDKTRGNNSACHGMVTHRKPGLNISSMQGQTQLYIIHQESY